jgi:hypothetical protein
MKIAPPFPEFITPHLSNDELINENFDDPSKKSAPPPPLSSVNVVEQLINEHSIILK